MININKAVQGAMAAQSDVEAAASAIAAANDKATAILAQAKDAEARNDAAAGEQLLRQARQVARELVLTRARYLKAVHTASFVKSIADLKQKASAETDPQKRAVLEQGAERLGMALKKFGATPIKVKLPSLQGDGLNGLDGGFKLPNIGQVFSSVGNFIKNNAGIIGTVAGTAAGAYVGGAQGAQLGAALGGTVGTLVQGNQQQAAAQAPAPGAPAMPIGGGGAFNAAISAAQQAGVPTNYGLPQQGYALPGQLPGSVPANPYANGYAAQQTSALFADPTAQLAKQPAPLLSPTMKTALYIGGGVALVGALGVGVLALSK